MIKLIWTTHAIQRGYTRLGKKYGMDNISKKILENINNARPNRNEDTAVVPFKLGRKRCMAVIIPDGNDGNTAIIKSMMIISEQKHRAIFSKNK